MANFTRRAIKETFLKLLKERPLTHITVKDIVTECGINRNTFYYYFRDIPFLIEEIVIDDAERIISAYPTVEKIDECIEAAIDLALSKKRAVLHIYNSVNREVYEEYLWRICDHVVSAYVNQVLNGRQVSEDDLKIINKYVSSLGFGIFSGWLRDGMNEDIRETFDRIVKIKKGMIEEMISRCEEE